MLKTVMSALSQDIYQLTAIIDTCITLDQVLSKDLEIGSPKLSIVKFMGFLFFKEDHNI